MLQAGTIEISNKICGISADVATFVSQTNDIDDMGTYILGVIELIRSDGYVIMEEYYTENASEWSTYTITKER